MTQFNTKTKFTELFRLTTGVIMKKFRVLITLLSILILSQSAYAANESVQDHPGYVDFTTLSSIAGIEPSVEISLRGPMLNMITNLLKSQDKETASFISKLLRVSVLVFDSDQIDMNSITDTMSDISSDLDRQDWERVVRVREDESHVDIYFRLSSDSEVIYGIAIMVVEENETVLVNIVGDIMVEDLSALGERFDIEELVDIDIN